MKGIYLGACRAYHPNYDIDYNDIIPGEHINVIGDMLTINIEKYDYIIGTPPCNYYSRANYRRNESKYAQETKHLLPDLLKKCIKLNKPFIIENVRNYNIYKKEGILDIINKNGIFMYEYKRHTYFTNVMFSCYNIPQIKDNVQNTNNTKKTYRQGGYNVHQVIEYWIKIIESTTIK